MWCVIGSETLITDTLEGVFLNLGEYLRTPKTHSEICFHHIKSRAEKDLSEQERVFIVYLYKQQLYSYLTVNNKIT